ncbi:response regulator containing a CheY-like receiver domain and an HTH DNA-binding domain [Opitutaceae bacterium TAV1]|nr:response regulator containing a CheY-like receiver domain and an HTH DNA-binding domain [Opitutaceae bacterium TAV1]
MQPISVLIVDDHQLMLEGIASLLLSTPDIRLVARAQNARDALELIKAHRPDIVVADLSMPGVSGLDLIQQIKDIGLPSRVVMLTMHRTRLTVHEAFSVGAEAFVLKSDAFEDLIDIIRRVYAGESKLTSKGLPPFEASIASTLSPREKDVLEGIAAGLSNKEISRRLAISSKTVETHRSRIMQKLNVTKATELVREAMRAGLGNFDTTPPFTVNPPPDEQKRG